MPVSSSQVEKGAQVVGATELQVIKAVASWKVGWRPGRQAAVGVLPGCQAGRLQLPERIVDGAERMGTSFSPVRLIPWPTSLASSLAPGVLLACHVVHRLRVQRAGQTARQASQGDDACHARHARFTRFG
jgi:hypothetical protein